METLHVIGELVAAWVAAGIAYATAYAAYLFLANDRKKLNQGHLTAFGLLAPLTWVGMTVITATAGAYIGFLPARISAMLYAAIATALPAAALSASTIRDMERRPPPPLPKNNRSTTIPPPPRDVW